MPRLIAIDYGTKRTGLAVTDPLGIIAQPLETVETKQLERYHADKLILSVDGIDTVYGLTTYYNKECTVDVTMLAQADTCIVAADRSKFGHSAFTKISDLSVADYIVTDGQLNTDIIEKLNSKGVTLLQ